MSDYFLNPGKEGIAKFFGRIYTLLEQASEGLDNTELNWRPSPKSNTIGILLKHIAVGEVVLVHEVTGGKERPRDRPDEFTMDNFQIETLREELAQVQATSKKVLAELTEEQMTKPDQSLREHLAGKCRSMSTGHSCMRLNMPPNTSGKYSTSERCIRNGDLRP